MNNISPEEQALIDKVEKAKKAYEEQYDKLLEKQEQYREAAALTPGEIGTEGNKKLIMDVDGTYVSERPSFTDASAKVEGDIDGSALIEDIAVDEDFKEEKVSKNKKDDNASTLEKPARSIKQISSDMDRISEALEKRQKELDAAEEELKNYRDKLDVKYDVEQIYNEGKYYPSRPGALTDKEIEKEMMDEYLRTHPEMKDEDLVVIRRMGVMDDEQGNIYEPYAIGKRVEKAIENNEEQIDNEGKYYPSRPGALTNEEIEKEMMDDYRRRHNIPEDEDLSDLEIVRSMGAMDDEQGNIYEPYAVIRKRKTKELEEAKKQKAKYEEELRKIENGEESYSSEVNETLNIGESTESSDNEDISEEIKEEQQYQTEETSEEIENKDEKDSDEKDLMLRDLQEALNSEDPEKLRAIRDRINSLIENDQKEVSNDEKLGTEIIDNEGKYYPSRPGALTNEEIEKEMMDDYRRRHNIPEDEDLSDLEIQRGMGVMDDEQGNIYEPYAVVKKQESAKEDDTPVIPEPEPEPEPEIVEDSEDQKVEEVERGYDYHEVIHEIMGDLDIGIKDVKRCNAANLRVWKTWKDELHSGQKDYNVLHAVGSFVTKVIGRGISKIVNKLLLTERAKANVEKVRERLNNLDENNKEDEKKLKAFERYIGSEVITNLDYLPINQLIMERIRKLKSKKVDNINSELRQRYNNLFTILAARDEILRQIGEKEDENLSEEYDKLMHQGAEIVKEIRSMKKTGGELLGQTGIHGMEETFKAADSKMNYEGLRHAKRHKMDSELNKQLAEYGAQLEEGLATGNDEDIVEGFLGQESIYADNTDIASGVFGDKTIGKKYYTPLLKELDYRPDPFLRDLFATIALTTAAVSAINAVKVHQIDAKEVLSNERNKADRFNDSMSQIEKDAQEQLGLTDKYSEGIKSQLHQDVVSVSDELERKALDMTDWKFGSKYNSLDDAHHEFYNGFYDEISTGLRDVATRRGDGIIDPQEAMQEIIQIANGSQRTLNEVAENCLDVLIPYAKNHPQFDLRGVQESLQYVVDHPSSITEMYDAIGKNVELSQDILDNIQYIEPLQQLPSDMISTLVAAAGSTALAHRVYKEMEDRGYRAKGYDDSITQYMQGQNYQKYVEDQLYEENNNIEEESKEREVYKEESDSPTMEIVKDEDDSFEVENKEREVIKDEPISDDELEEMLGISDIKDVIDDQIANVR